MVYLKRLSFEQTEQLNLVVEPSPWSFSSRSNLDPVVRACSIKRKKQKSKNFTSPVCEFQ